jgi:hypothetical protein
VSQYSGVRPLPLMNDLFLTSAVVALGLMALGGLVLQRVRIVSRRRAKIRRAQGYRLIHALRAYSAWVESQRDRPFIARSLEELTSPEPLTLAGQIKRDWFPGLGRYMVPLLQAHSRFVEYLWEQSLLRLSQGSGWRPAYQDARYQQLRGAQEELIDEMIAACRELIGDTPHAWRRTGSDFAFSNSIRRASHDPAGRA